LASTKKSNSSGLKPNLLPSNYAAPLRGETQEARRETGEPGIV
jgi:hypothetical protein